MKKVLFDMNRLFISQVTSFQLCLFLATLDKPPCRHTRSITSSPIRYLILRVGPPITCFLAQTSILCGCLEIGNTVGGRLFNLRALLKGVFIYNLVNLLGC